MSQALLSKIADEGIEYVDIRFTDPRGKLQHVTVCADQVDQDFLDEGFMFDGSSIAGWKSIEESDMNDTVRILPSCSTFRSFSSKPATATSIAKESSSYLIRLWGGYPDC